MNPVADPLAALRDIHLPSTPAFWPPAPGWWLLALLVLALSVFIGVLIVRRYRRQRPLKELLAALERVETGTDPQVRLAAVQEMSMLLRRFALLQFGRRRVAGLQGDAWLAFLDQTGGSRVRFSEGPGRLIASAPYAPAADIEVAPLREAIGTWAKETMRGKTTPC